MRLTDADLADREVADLLRLLDHAAPPLDFASVQRQAGARDRARGLAVRWGAIILGFGAAAAAAALPSVRQFVAHAVGARHAVQPVPARIVQSTTPAVASTPVAPRGVAIIPDGRVDLIFRTAQPGGVLRIRPAAGQRVAVTASADGSTYMVGRGKIVVDTRATGVTYDIELPAPADLLDVSIRIGDREVFSRHGAIVHTRGALEADGSYRIPMSSDDASSP
jgi:hypothetical protein